MYTVELAVELYSYTALYSAVYTTPLGTWRPLNARRPVLHDLDAALSGRLRRGRYASAARAFISDFADRLRQQARGRRKRGGALGAGGGRVGFAGGGLF